MIIVLSLFVWVVLFYWAIDKYDFEDDAWAAWFFLAFAPFVVSLFFVGFSQIGGKFKHLDMIAQREALVYRLENETSDSIITQNPQLYAEIVSFNSTVLKTSYASESLWFNWFVYAPIGELELIELAYLSE